MISVERYRAITGDDDTAASAVEEFVAEAQDMLEDCLDRPLESAERTESMRPDRHGNLWPKATPITDGGDYTVDGLALVGGSPFWGGIIDPTTSVSVTYTGGWTDETLPKCIERDLAMAAYRLGHPPALGTSEYPEGATSVRLGDAAVTFGPGGAGAVGTGDSDGWWSKRTRSYRYASVHSGPPALVSP